MIKRSAFCILRLAACLAALVVVALVAALTSPSGSQPVRGLI